MKNSLLSAVDLARWILPESSPMTLRKLQKILYYAQAWSLVWEDVPLFKEKIVACSCCGPMIVELQEYAISQFAKLPPKKKGVYEVFNTHMDLCFHGLPHKGQKLKKSQEKTVLDVYQTYNNHPTLFLEALSKEEGPFKKAQLSSKEGESSPVIALEWMKRYYSAVDQVRKSETFLKEYGKEYQFILDAPAWEA